LIFSKSVRTYIEVCITKFYFLFHLIAHSGLSGLFCYIWGWELLNKYVW